ncbi:MAG: FkbM family methyltransferase [Pseudomonadota bacterium]
MNSILNYIYKNQVKHYLSKNEVLKIFSRLYGFVRKLILAFYDPMVEMKIGNRNLAMNLSHELPLNMAAHHHYNTGLVRIAAFLHNRNGNLAMIDVGANIGDTVSLVSDAVKGDFLCIEADEKYYQHLLANTKHIDNVTCVKALCDEVADERETAISIIRNNSGSSQVSEQRVDGNSLVNKITVDSLIEKMTIFKKTDLIKVDTDGYDYKVIRGCDQLITAHQPVFFFELAPMFLKKTGESPDSIFEYLSKKGYKNVLFYDHVGLPVLYLDTGNKNLICQLIEYADRKDTYFDVLIMHDSREDDFRLFLESEMRFFK